MRHDAKVGLRDAELADDVVEARLVLKAGEAGPPDIVAWGHELHDPVEQFLLRLRLDGDVPGAPALGAGTDVQEGPAFRKRCRVPRAGGIAGDDGAVGLQVPCLLAPQAEAGLEFQLQAYPVVEAGDLRDLAGDVDVHGRPAAVFRGNFRSMGVRRVGADVELRLAHHARLADPARERSQEAEVVVDGRGGEATFQPPRHHGFDVAVGQLPRIEVAVRRLVAQLAEEADHHALSVVHGLERHALVLLAVLAVVLREVGADDAQVVGGAHRQRCKDDVGVRRGTRRWTPRMGVGSRQSVVQRARRVLR